MQARLTQNLLLGCCNYWMHPRPDRVSDFQKLLLPIATLPQYFVCDFLLAGLSAPQTLNGVCH